MGRRLESTPRSKVRASLRALWLRSRERAAAIKRDQYTCVHCGKKQSKAKGREQAIEVHHRDGIEWDMILDYIYRHILVDPSKLETVCPDCHKTLEACDKAERAGI